MSSVPQFFDAHFKQHTPWYYNSCTTNRPHHQFFFGMGIQSEAAASFGKRLC